MQIPRNVVPSILLLVSLAFTIAGCNMAGAGLAGKPAGGKTAGAVAPAAAATVQITLPESGTPSERVRALWQSTKPVLEADTSAQLTGAEVQARKIALTTPWAALKAQLTGGAAPQEGAPASQAATDVLAALNELYNVEAAKADTRIDPATIAHHIATLDERIQALP